MRKLHTAVGGDLPRKRQHLGLRLLQLGAVGIAQIHGHHGLCGNHIDQIGFELQRTDGAQLTPTIARHQFGNEGGGAHGTYARVVAQGHGGGTGVVAGAVEAELHPANALHAFDHADLLALLLQHRALFDMQLDKAVHLRRTHGCSTGVANALQLGPYGGAVVHSLHRQRFIQRHAAHHHQAAHHVGLKARAFFVGKERYLDGPARAHTGFNQRGHHFQPRHHAIVAVIQAAGAHGVDMAAGHHRRQVFGAGIGGDHIANGIGLHRHAQLPHLRHRPVAPGFVGITQGQAIGTTAFECTKLAQLFQALQQPCAVDAQCFQITHATPLAARLATACALSPTSSA